MTEKQLERIRKLGLKTTQFKTSGEKIDERLRAIEQALESLSFSVRELTDVIKNNKE